LPALGIEPLTLGFLVYRTILFTGQSLFSVGVVVVKKRGHAFFYMKVLN
jgi:hypothetical protein